MPNPTYGDTYVESMPTPYVDAYAVTADRSTASLNVAVPSSGATMQFRVLSPDSLRVRVAYQLRKRYTAYSGSWDGGETWTDWQNSGGTVDAWTEMYTTAETSTTLVTNIGQCTTTTVSLPYNILTYDAIEYRVQAWCITGSGGSISYGSPATQTIRIDYAPAFVISDAIANLADNSLMLQLVLANDAWGRGAEAFCIDNLRVGGVSIPRADSKASGEFKYSSDVAAALIEAGSTIDVTAHIIPNGSSANLQYTVNKAMTALNPSSAVTAPTVTTSTVDGMLAFSAADDSYNGVTVIATWNGGSAEIEATLSGGNWTADATVPFNSTVSYRVTAYKTVLGVQRFNYTEGTATLVGMCYELRADDGSTLTMTLEAKEQMTWDVDSATITLASGRTVARHGLGNKRTWTLRGQLLGSSHSATSDWIDALAILNLPQNLTYRNPYGEVARVCVTSWTRNPASIWDVLDISVSFTEVE